MAWLLRLEDMPLIELGTRADMDDRPPWPPPPTTPPDPAETLWAAAAAAALCEPRLVPLKLVLAPPLGSVEASDCGRLE